MKIDPPRMRKDWLWALVKLHVVLILVALVVKAIFP